MDEPIIAKDRVFQECTLKLTESSKTISLNGEIRDGHIRTFIEEESEYVDLTLIYDPNGADSFYQIRILQATEKIPVKNLIFHSIITSCHGMVHGDEKKYAKWYVFICKIWL